jgi:hypothetical protein
VQTREDLAKEAKPRVGRSIQAEDLQILREKEGELSTMITAAGLGDSGTNPSGLYELCGEPQILTKLTEAMVTHKGSSADSGQ